jgi:hypothetical protein
MSTVVVKPASINDPVHHSAPVSSITPRNTSDPSIITPVPPVAVASRLLPPLASGTGIDGIAYRDRLISRQALAHWLGISPTRLGVWAREGYGPTPRRCGGVKLYYVVGEVLDFIQASPAGVWPDVRRKAHEQSESLTED